MARHNGTIAITNNGKTQRHYCNGQQWQYTTITASSQYPTMATHNDTITMANNGKTQWHYCNNQHTNKELQQKNRFRKVLVCVCGWGRVLTNIQTKNCNRRTALERYLCVCMWMGACFNWIYSIKTLPLFSDEAPETNPFMPEFLKWTLLSLDLDMSIGANWVLV